jgi:hypothetical protein
MHPSVRGSFFATTSAALREIGHFEVFWDRFRISDAFGNHSLVATCARFAEVFGNDAFAYLGTAPRESPFLRELVRGCEEGPAGVLQSSETVSGRQRLKDAARRLFLRIYIRSLEIYVRLCGTSRFSLGRSLVRPLLMLPAARLSVRRQPRV